MCNTPRPVPSPQGWAGRTVLFSFGGFARVGAFVAKIGQPCMVCVSAVDPPEAFKIIKKGEYEKKHQPFLMLTNRCGARF